jgi:myosin protein heavy chain
VGGEFVGFQLTDVLQIVQRRNAQAEVEDNRRQIQDLNRTKKQLQRELSDVKDRLEAELAAKNDESSGSFPLLLYE